jgi:hypothetical protein
MEKFLKDYIDRIRPTFSRISEETGHVIASVFFSFKFELYPKTLRECSTALSLVPEGNGSLALKTALSVVREYAVAYENAQVRPESIPFFEKSDQPYLAVTLAPELIEDPLTLDLDNALLLLYGVAVITSPDDEQALEEHRKYLVKILDTYKRALGMF